MTATLEERVTVLENRMDEQEGLRASQDRDLSDIAEGVRVQSGLLKALSKTQSEHGKMLARHTSILDQLTATIDEHTATLDNLTTTIGKHTATLDRHTGTLDRHTALLGELKTDVAFQSLTLRGMGDGQQRIIGMLDTLIQRDGDQ